MPLPDSSLPAVPSWCLQVTMEIWEAIIVGIVQGLSEFLPISSSGHIVLTQYLLGVREVGGEHEPDLAFEVILHVGTLISVLLFFPQESVASGAVAF